MKSYISWEESKNLCEQNGSKLVSMERLRAELNFLENRSEARKMDTTEYYIGLRKNGQKWMWVSDNSTLEETKRGQFPWASTEPTGNGNCVKMWRQKTSPWTYVYDDVNCTVSTSHIGYICERTSASLKCGSNAVKPTDKAKSSATELFSVRESSTLLVPPSFRKSITPITYKDTTERNKIHTISSTSYVDNRRYGSDTNSVSWVMAIFIGGGVVLVIAFGTNAILVIKLRRVTQTRDGSRADARSEIAERIQLENQSSSLNPAQDTVATRLSGMSDENGDHGRLEVQTRQQPRTTDCGYTMLSQSTMTQSERVYASLDSL